MEAPQAPEHCRYYHILRDPFTKKVTRPPLTIRYSRETNYITLDCKVYFRPAAYSAKTIGDEITAAIGHFYKSDERLAFLDSRRTYEEENIVTFDVITKPETPTRFTRNGYPFSPPEGSIEKAMNLSAEEKTALFISRERARQGRTNLKAAAAKDCTDTANSGQNNTAKGKPKAAQATKARKPDPARGEIPQLMVPRIIHAPGGGAILIPAKDAAWDEPRKQHSPPRTSVRPTSPGGTLDSTGQTTPDSAGTTETEVDEPDFKEINELLYDGKPPSAAAAGDGTELAELPGAMADIQGDDPGAKPAVVTSAAKTKEEPTETQGTKAPPEQGSGNTHAAEAKSDPPNEESKETRSADAPDSGKSSNADPVSTRESRPTAQERLATSPKSKDEDRGSSGPPRGAHLFNYTPQTLGQQQQEASRQQQPQQKPHQQQHPQTQGQQQQQGKRKRKKKPKQQPQQPDKAQQQQRPNPQPQPPKEVPTTKETTEQQQQPPNQQQEIRDEPQKQSATHQVSSPEEKKTAEGQQQQPQPQHGAEARDDQGPPNSAAAKGNQGSPAPADDSKGTSGGSQGPDKDTQDNGGRSQKDTEALAQELIAEHGLTMEAMMDAHRDASGALNMENFSAWVKRTANSNYNTCKWPPTE